MSAHRLFAALLLSCTAITKAVGLAAGPQWIHHPDPLLHLPNWAIVWLAIGVELVVALSLFIPGRIPILALRGLTGVFAAYHTANQLGGVKEPCSCLGTLADWWPSLRDHTGGITLLFLLLLAWLSSFENPKSAPPLPSSSRDRNLAVAGTVLGWILIGTIGIVFGSGSRLGGDEGMELSKLALVQSHQGFRTAWNDQNWLFTLFLRVGASIHPGVDFLRAFCFSLTLPIPVVVALLCARVGRPFSALLFPLLVGSQVGAVALLPSVMMEPAAIGLATAAAIPLLIGNPTSARFWLSGAIAALACTMKPTAAFALLPVVVIAHQTGGGARFLLSAGLSGVAFVAGSIWCGLVRPETFLQSHLAKPSTTIAWDAFGASAAGTLLLSATVSLWSRASAVWTTGLFAAVCILSLHNPAWTYYHVHFWVPAAGLTVLALRSWVAGWIVGLICVLLCAHQARLIRAQATVLGGKAADWIPAITQAAPQSMYASDPALYYLAGVPPHPDYALLPFKRTWAGHSPAQLSNDLQRIRPQLMVLSGEQAQQIGTNGYQVVGARADMLFLALPEVGIEPESPQPSILQRIGM